MQLAQMYCPAVMPESAWKRFKRWMRLYPGLMERLTAIGYTDHSRSYLDAAKSRFGCCKIPFWMLQMILLTPYLI